MKSVLRAAGVPCARHQLVHRTEEATWLPGRGRLPHGGQAAGRRGGAGHVSGWTTTETSTPGCGAAQHDPGEVWLLEEFLTGREHTFDSVTLDGDTIWASISDYRPPPLEVLRTPWVQWTVVLPRDIDGPEYDAIKQIGPAALRALGVRDRVHPHGVVRATRRIGGGLGGRGPTTRRPARVHDRLQPRRRLLRDVGRAGAPRHVRADRTPVYATGTAYLRGQGRGRVRTVHGVDELQREVGHLVVDAGCRSPGSRRRQLVRGRGLRHRAASTTPPWSGPPSTGSSAGSGRAVEADRGRTDHDKRRHAVAGLPAGDGLLHPSAGPDRGHGDRGRRPAGRTCCRRRRGTIWPTTSTSRWPTRTRCSAALHGLARHARIDQVECLWEPYMVLAARIREDARPAGDDGRADAAVPGQGADEAGAGRRRHPHPPARQHLARVQGVWAAAEQIGYPLIVKPIAGAGSADTYRVDSLAELADRAADDPARRGGQRRGVHRGRGVHLRHGLRSRRTSCSTTSAGIGRDRCRPAATSGSAR